jgi:hypothetical protein
MHARITKSFRIAEGEGTRKYTPGDVAEGQAAKLAVENGWGKKISQPEKAKSAPQNKSATPDQNKNDD